MSANNSANTKTSREKNFWGVGLHSLIERRWRNKLFYIKSSKLFTTRISMFVFEFSKIGTAENTVISLNFLVWKFCGKAQFPQSFKQIARNYVETVPFHKIFTPGNSMKLRYFTQWGLTQQKQNNLRSLSSLAV